jgi:ABC-2 type transport system permease protein
MKNILLMAKNDIKIMFNKKSSIFVFIVLPVLIAVLAYALLGNDGSGVTRIGLVNNDTKVFSKDLVKSLKDNKNFKVTMLKANQLKNEVANQNIDCGVVIPKGFTDNVYKNKIKPFKVISIKGADVTTWITSYLNLYAGDLADISGASQGDTEKFNQMYKTFNAEKIKLNVKEIKDIKNEKASAILSMGFVVMFLLSAATVTANMILKDKTNRTYFRICCAPVRPIMYILSNVIANLAVIFSQIILILVSIKYILGFDMHAPIISMMIVLGLFGVIAVGFGLLIAAFSDNNAQASNLSSIIITPTCMLGGCWWPIDIMPKTLQRVSDFMPQKWALDTIGKLQEGKTLFELRSNLLILVVFALVFFLVAGYKFKTQDSVKNIV